MESAVSIFNSLDGRKVSREVLEQLQNLAYDEEQFYLIKRINAVLLNSNADHFIINLADKAVSVMPESLSGAIPFIESESASGLKGLGKAVSANEIYQTVTDLILNTIEEVGHLPWQKEWKGSGLPTARNYVTGAAYTGINAITLPYEVDIINSKKVIVRSNHKDIYYLTFNQIQKLKATLKKGSVSRMVVYFSFLFNYSDPVKKLKYSTSSETDIIKWAHQNKITEEEFSDNVSRFPILKYYNVFKATDCENLPEKHPEKINADPIEIAEKVIDLYPNSPLMEIGATESAAYSPGVDTVYMPALVAFDKNTSYYSTFFHELIHSTGHSKRLNRGNDTRHRDGSKEDKAAYAFEELVAELGAVYLCAETGILFNTIENSAKYLKGWNLRLVEILKEDNKFFFRAAAQAQKAQNYILDSDGKGIPAYQHALEKEALQRTLADEQKKKQAAENEAKRKARELKKERKSAKTKNNNLNTGKVTNQLALFGLHGIEVSTEAFKEMTVTELRQFTLEYYKKYLKGKELPADDFLSAIKLTDAAGRKIAKGGSMYSEKAAIVEKLEDLIKSSTYNNWGDRKETDPKSVLGYLNFKSKVTIDGVKRHVRISIIVTPDRKTHLKNAEVGNKKDSATSSGRKTIPANGEVELSRSKGKQNTDNQQNKPLNAPETALLPVVPLQQPVVNEPVVVPKPKPSIPTPAGVMSSDELMNMEFETIQFEGEWSNFLPNPAKNIRLAIFGKPKNGKTAGSTALAKQLSNFGNVLYVFADQGISESTKILWRLAGLDQVNNVHLSNTTNLDELDKLLVTGNYDYVVLDMLNTFIDRSGIRPHEFRERFYDKYPDIGFIFVMEATKSGDFKGAQAWMHLPDQVVNVSDYVMETYGRYGMGHYVVWPEGLQKINPKRYAELYEEETTEPDPEIVNQPVNLPFIITEY